MSTTLPEMYTYALHKTASQKFTYSFHIHIMWTMRNKTMNREELKKQQTADKTFFISEKKYSHKID